MTPYYSDSWLTVWQGDCVEVMAQMEPESVHCVVTSPPYWGLRDYGTAIWLGGDELHAHEGSVMRTAPPGTEKQASNKGASAVRSGPCRCGAVRQDSQLGLEPTPEEYVANMVAVFREVRRVLRADGTCWVNLGDSYARQGGKTDGVPRHWDGRQNDPGGMHAKRAVASEFGAKPKDLVGIPWRVAFALQADGWYLRSDIIWSKPNPMPESVTDRPTKAHEYLFLLSKSPRYYYDSDAVREAAIYEGVTVKASNPDTAKNGQKGKYGATALGFTQHDTTVNGRNLRSVWTIATQPYPGAHFATFPEKLVEPCVKAGTSERGVCPECGAPWRRVVEREAVGDWRKDQLDRIGTGNAQDTGLRGENFYANYQPPKTTGWQPSCTHDLPPVPSTVCDPFAGSGTTGRVAQRLGRRAVLIDLNADYLTQAMKRNSEIPLGLETA